MNNSGFTLVDVRAEAMDVIVKLKNKEIDVKTAQEVRNLLGTIVDCAKTQVEFLKATHFGEPYIHIRKRKNGYEEKVWMIQHNQKRKAYLKNMCIMAGVDMTNKIPRLKDGYDYSKVPTIDDVIIIDRRINLEMNSFHNYPQEIKDVIHIKAVLTRQINKQLKDE